LFLLADDDIRHRNVIGVQTCSLSIYSLGTPSQATGILFVRNSLRYAAKKRLATVDCFPLTAVIVTRKTSAPSGVTTGPTITGFNCSAFICGTSFLLTCVTISSTLLRGVFEVIRISTLLSILVRERFCTIVILRLGIKLSVPSELV